MRSIKINNLISIKFILVADPLQLWRGYLILIYHVIETHLP